MRPDSEYGRIIMPYVIGFHGRPQAWVESEIIVLESNGSSVYPESLYEAQVELRKLAASIDKTVLNGSLLMCCV